MNKKYATKAEINAAAHGRWREVLEACGIPSEILDKIIIHARHVVVLTDSGLPMAAAQVAVAVFGFVTSASQMAAARLIC